MADTEPVRPFPVPENRLPEMVDIDLAAGLPPHSPRETMLLREMTGRDMDELTGEGADFGTRETVMVWMRLRRLGFEPTWDEATGVLINYTGVNPPGSGG